MSEHLVTSAEKRRWNFQVSAYAQTIAKGQNDLYHIVLCSSVCFCHRTLELLLLFMNRYVIQTWGE
jgi:hypothetical protein